jgi:transposase
VLVDALGNPLRLLLTAAQVHDITQAGALIDGYHPDFVTADKGYDAAHFIAAIENQGAEPVIPPRSNRTHQRYYDPHLYRERHLVECFVNKIKQYRRVFTRYDKLASHYLGFACLAATLVWLK